MSITAAQLVANVSVIGADQAKAALNSVGSAADSTGNTLKKSLGTALGVAAGVGAVAIGSLTAVLVDSTKVAMKHQDVMAQTVQALKSTKDASGETAASISKMSEALSKTTKFSEDTIQSGQNLLLTFTGIGKDVFPETTQAMLDLSQATGQDMKSSAIQLGKALNDPLTGMSALQRVGVTFSASEKEQIKTMMAHNDTIGAQKVMLHELETEFGGSATAAGKTFAGQIAILKNNFEDLKVKIGTAILPILGQFMGFVTSTIMPQLGKLADWFANTAVPALQKFGERLQPLGGLLKTFGDVGKKALGDIQNILFQVGEILSPITDKFTGIGGKVQSGLGGAIAAAGPIIKSFGDNFHNAAITIEKVLSTINIRPMIDSISGTLSHIDFKPLEDGAKSVGKFLGDVFSHIDFKAIGNDVKTVGQIFLNLSPAGNLLQALAGHAQELGKWFNTSVVPALKGAEPGFKNLGGALAGLLPAFKTISDVVHNSFQAAFNALLPVFEKAIPIIIRIAGIVADSLGAAIKFLTPYVVQAAQAIGKFASDIAQRVAPIISQFFDNLKKALDWIQKYWPQIWGTIAPFLQGVWDIITGIVKVAWALVSGIIKIGLDLLSGNWKQAWTDVKDMLGGIWDGIKDVIKGGINGMIGVLNLGIDALNGFIDAVENALNSAAKAVGLGSPIPITKIGLIPAYASGTDSHPGGAALVGEKGPEIALLPKGTSVIPASMTSRILSGVPAYADGTGNILDNLMSWVSGGAQSILDNILKGLGLKLNLGEMSGMAGGIVKTVEKWALDWINKTLMPKLPSGGTGDGGGSAGPGQAVNVPGNVASWIMAAIGLTGVPSSWLNALETIAMHESGGNPNAVNNWDINAQEGHPSEGLMQTIGPTFAAHMVAGHGNILNPIDNAAAAIRYIQAVYGSVFNVPGIKSMASGGAYQGYADGTSFAAGGFSWVGERGKELMYVPRGAQITPHEQLSRATQQPQITVNPPGVYLDGRTLVNGLMPYITDAIRYNVGTHNI